MLHVSAGMPRAGSGWIYNLTNDLVVAAGGRDARQVREELGLDDVLWGKNCNIGRASARKLARVLPVARSTSFVVKTHNRPTPALQFAVLADRVRATYIHRDPRDVIVSAMEEGARMRGRGVERAFAPIHDLDDALRESANWLAIQRWWARSPGVLVLRYEDLQADTASWVERIAEHQGLDVPASATEAIVARYEPGNAIDAAHFRTGGSGRYREFFEPDDVAKLDAALAPDLARLGYR